MRHHRLHIPGRLVYVLGIVESVNHGPEAGMATVIACQVWNVLPVVHLPRRRNRPPRGRRDPLEPIPANAPTWQG